jgi:DNA-binding NarL/FixJ family response regulator
MLVDDQPQFRQAMQDLIAEVPGYEIVCECTSGEQSVKAVASYAPDLVLMDVRMPGIDGVEATRRITAAHPGTVVVLISAQDPDSCLTENAGSCGAAEFVPKQELRPSRLVALWERHGNVDDDGPRESVL